MSRSRIFKSKFFIKLFHWEYWPFGIVQGPFFLYWLWLALRSRALFFFSASNPSIPTGGMMGESKFDVLGLLPDEVKPKTIKITVPSALAEVQRQMLQAGMNFPVIFKPDLGERGWMVKRILNEEQAIDYLKKIKIDFIVQELVTLPLEYGVFYVRMPDEDRGKVVSITGKEFLSVTGDGKKTLQQLILAKDRARLQWDTLRSMYADRLEETPGPGEKIELVSIGNHCLGTTFLNANHLITPALNESFDRISKQVPGFYFGRYDLRTATEKDLEDGKVKVVELNGCGAEPAHIYHPGASIIDALKVLHRHWITMYRISRMNHKRGVPYLTFAEGRKIFRHFRAAQQAD